MRHIMICALGLIAMSGIALAQGSTQLPPTNGQIPEPATIAMFAAGAGLVFARARRRNKNK